MDRLRQVMMVAAIIFSLFLYPLWTKAAEEINTPKETIRVGFFAMEGYHMIDDNGDRSGYGYEFLKLLSRYTNWEYEYVGYDKSWQDMLYMLEKGDIDLVTSAQKTGNREAKFDFSSRAIGTSSTIFTVRAGNDHFVAGDYTTYNGARVGLLRGNSRNDAFVAYAAARGFTYIPVYYDSSEAMTAALQDGTDIDAIVTSNLRFIKNEWILNQFAPSPFYVIVRKGDSRLLGEIDQALQQLDIYNQGWQSALFNKYYSPDGATTIGFTATERRYLKELQDKQIRFKVAMNPDNAPYSYIDDQGQPAGIIPEIFAEVANRAGISYDVLPAATYAEYNQFVHDGTADIDMNACTDFAEGDKRGLEITDSYLDLFVGQLTRTDFNGEIHSVALPEGIHLLHDGRTEILQGKIIQSFSSTQECVEAVINGQCDAAYLYSFTAQMYLRKEVRNQLRFTLISKPVMGASIGVSSHCDYRLIAMLDKSVASMRGSVMVRQITMKYTNSMLHQEFSLERYLYAHPLIAVFLAVLMVLIIAAAIFYVQRIRAGRLDEQRRQELERFIGYVLNKNDQVNEVDLRRRICRRYLQKGEHISYRDLPYDLPTYMETAHPDDREALGQHFSDKALQDMIADGRVRYFECRLLWHNGIYHWYANTLQGMPRTVDHPQSFIMFSQDIHESKEAEERNRHALKDALETARHASQAKGDFLSQMSHEIRTPLNAVIGYLTLAQMPGMAGEKVRHCLKNGEIASKHLLNIINDVLDLSAIESGRFKIAAVPFDLVLHITSLTTIFTEQARAKGIEFYTDTYQLYIEKLVGDQLRLNQILMNLLSNAVKFTPAGGMVSLKIQEDSLDAKHVMVRFQVKDTGIGMSEAYLERIFTPFEQENAKTAKEFGGTGLGLSITKNLIDMMGGSIEVSSKLQQGSTFVVSLPFLVDTEGMDTVRNSVAADNDNNANASIGNIMEQDLSDISILLVEDNPMNREITVAILSQTGMHIDTANDGQEAVDLFTATAPGTYQCIFMDLQMPVLNGFDAARGIRASAHEEALSIPIIALTADVLAEDMAKASACGMNGYISKPVDYQKLLDTLKQYIHKH